MEETIKHIEIIEKEITAAKQAMLGAEKTASAASSTIDATMMSLMMLKNKAMKSDENVASESVPSETMKEPEQELKTPPVAVSEPALVQPTGELAVPQSEDAPQPVEEVAPQPVEEVAPQPVEEVAPQPAEEVAPQPAEEVAPQPEEAPQPAEEVAPQPAAAPQPAGEVTPSMTQVPPETRRTGGGKKRTSVKNNKKSRKGKKGKKGTQKTKKNKRTRRKH